MGTPEMIMYLAVVLLLALPVCPLALAWGRLIRMSRSSVQLGAAPTLLLVMTTSYLLLLLGLVLKNILGPDYSTRRFATIYLNLTVMLMITLWTSLKGSPLRSLLIVVSALLTALCAYFAILISVV